MHSERELILGTGFDPVRFWIFNTIMFVEWFSLNLMQTFAIIGVGAIFQTATEEVATSSLGTLGMAFVNLMYAVPLLIIAMLITVVWIYGNAYILRKELYELAERYFRWGDL